MNRLFPCIGVASVAAGLLFQPSTAPAQESGTPRERTTVDYTKALPLQDPAELLRLGTEAYEHGYFSQCLALWPRAWEAGRDAADEKNTRAVADRAFAEWMRMLCRLGRTAELRAGLAS